MCLNSSAVGSSKPAIRLFLAISARPVHYANARTFLLVDRNEHVCPRWWLRHSLKDQAREAPRLTTQWPAISTSPPFGTGRCGQRGLSRTTADHAPGNKLMCCLSPTVSAASRTCSLSLPLGLQQRIRSRCALTGCTSLWECPCRNPIGKRPPVLL